MSAIETVPYTFTGARDATVQLEMDGVVHELDAWEGADVVLRAPDGDVMLLVCRYIGEHGVWAVAPTVLSEAHPFPGWDVVVEAGPDDGVAVTVHVPEGTDVEPA